MQRILAFEDISPDTILLTNKSVESMVDAVAALEINLKQKMDLFEACAHDELNQ